MEANHRSVITEEMLENTKKEPEKPSSIKVKYPLFIVVCFNLRLKAKTIFLPGPREKTSKFLSKVTNNKKRKLPPKQKSGKKLSKPEVLKSRLIM